MGKEDQVDNVNSWVTYFQTLTIRFGSVYQFWSPSSFHFPYTQEGWKACIVGEKKRKKTSAIIATHWRGIYVHIILMVCDGGPVQAHHRLSRVATYTKGPKELPPCVSWVLDERRNPPGVTERWPLMYASPPMNLTRCGGLKTWGGDWWRSWVKDYDGKRKM